MGDEERFEVVVLREGVVGVRVGDRRSMYYVPSRSDDGSGAGKKGRKREERHRRDTSASPPRVLAESVELTAYQPHLIRSDV